MTREQKLEVIAKLSERKHQSQQPDKDSSNG